MQCISGTDAAAACSASQGRMAQTAAGLYAGTLRQKLQIQIAKILLTLTQISLHTDCRLVSLHRLQAVCTLCGDTGWTVVSLHRLQAVCTLCGDTGWTVVSLHRLQAVCTLCGDTGWTLVRFPYCDPDVHVLCKRHFDSSAEGGLPSSHQPENLAPSSHRT